MDFINWLNNVYYDGDGDFVDENDYTSFAEEADLTPIEDIKKEYERYAALNNDRAEVDNATDSVDVAEDEDDSDDYISLEDNEKVSDEHCKEVIDDMSNDELAPVYKWARANYEPAKGMSDQEIGMKFAIDDDWATELATAYYDANPDLLDKEEGDDDEKDMVEETTIISEEDTDGDGNTDKVSVDVSGDGVSDDTITADEIEVEPVEDDTVKNILAALTEHRY